MRLSRDVDVPRVVGHSGLVRKTRELADSVKHAFDIVHELLVTYFEIAAAADPAAQPARGLHLRSPLAGEPRRIARVHPVLRDDPPWHGEERRRRVAPVTDQVNEERIGEEPLQQPQVLHVHRRLVPPTALSVLLGVDRVHRPDRGSDRRRVREPGTHSVERHIPFGERVDPAKIVDELVCIDAAQMTIGELGDEVRLVRNSELGVPVEHDAEKRRPRAPHPEDQQGRSTRRGGHLLRRTRTITGAVGRERFPARSSATSARR